MVNGKQHNNKNDYELLETKDGTDPIPSIDIKADISKNQISVGQKLEKTYRISDPVTNGKDWNWLWGKKYIFETRNVYI